MKKEEERSNNIRWFLQILVLIAIAVLILLIAFNVSSWIINYIFLLVLIWIFYICSCFNSKIYKLLRNKKDTEYLIENLKKLCTRSNMPKLNLRSISYHNIIRRNKRVYRKVRDITHEEIIEFKYCSFRDISGVLNFSDFEKDKRYIKLNLKLNVDFSDEETKLEYNTIKDLLIERNIKKDEKHELIEDWLLADLNEENLINLQKGEPLFFNLYGFYLFSIIIPLFQFYNLYCNSCFHEITFDIKKLVSTRLNLNDEENKKKYDNLSPKLLCKGNYIHLDDNNFIVNNNNNNNNDLPNQDNFNQSENSFGKDIAQNFENKNDNLDVSDKFDKYKIEYLLNNE
jgi:hypothetical protein